ncbi:YadA-like family protein [Pasteurella canis]|uniref:YadA-like family protein n=1 Tax=Pasteurella canis TaxID=753 RepID=UPI001CBDD33C|nr:YadA-like family protein [Pasteurella canis]UAX42917.1 YadA-like family protein [Pasteurella canis]
MNKVYRVIWSHVTNTFIAVSELTTSKGKVKSYSVLPSHQQAQVSTSIPTSFKLSAIAVLSLLTFSPASVMAQDVNANNLTVNGTSTFTGAATFNNTATFNNMVTVGEVVATTLTVGGKNVATKEEITTLTSAVNQKADQNTVTDLTKTVNQKANQSDVDSLKTVKADKTELTTGLNLKADKSTVNTELAKKANKADFEKLSTLVASLGSKEGTEYSGIKYFRVKSTLADAEASGENAIAIGPKAVSSKDDALAVGHFAIANAEKSVAMGNSTYAVKTANKGVAIGNDARVGSKQEGDVVYDGSSSYVIGDGDGESSVAIGDKAISRGKASIAIGKDAITSNKDLKKQIASNNIAIGTSAQAIASDNSIALGNKARTNKDSDSSIAIGDLAETFAENAVALGKAAHAKGRTSVAIGLNAKSHTESTVAIGTDSEALSSNSIAIGQASKAMPNRTISIGLNAGKGQESDKEGTKHSHINIGENAGENVVGQYNIGIGTEAGKGVVGKANVALGIYAGTNLANSKETVGDNVSIGNAANNYKVATAIQRATAIGSQSLTESDATALGYDTKATGLKSTAVGFSAKAQGEQAVAIGANAVSDANNVALGANSIARAKELTSYLTGKKSSLVVSVGSQEGNNNQHILRRLTNVADGADEQDAVTVAQLKRVSEDVTTKLQAQFNNLAHGSTTSEIKYDTLTPDVNSGANHKITLKEKTRISNVARAINGTDAVNLDQLRETINTEKTHYFSVNDKNLADRPSNYDNDGAVGKLSIAIGQSVIAREERSVAIGNQASAHGLGSIAIGTLYEGSAELDDGNAQRSATNAAISNQPYKYGLAIGAGANSEGNNSLAIGSLAATSNKDIQNGNVDRAIAIGYRAVSSAEKANAIGDRAVANSLTGNAFGSEAFSGAVSSNAIGTKANATGENSIAFGTHQNVTGKNSGSIGYAGALGNKETTVISGEGTYSLGNTNSTLTANESGIFGNTNEIKAKENARIVGNKNSIGAIEEKTHVPGTPPAAPANDLKDIYVTGYDNKISSDKKLAKDLSGLFVYGHNNKIAQLPDPDSTEEFTLTNSSVIGANNILNTKGSDYFVLGNNVTATLANSVYLGSNSGYVVKGASTAGNEAYANIADGSNKSGYTFAGNLAPVGVVTLGGVGTERRIQNLSAGLVSESSTDAINGSQLFALTRPLRFAGDNSNLSNPDAGKPNGDTSVISRSSNQGMKIIGGENDGNKLTTIADKNIGVITNGNHTLEVRLAKTLSNLTEATFGSGTDKTTINKDGVTIVNNGKPDVSLTDSGLNNGGNKITNVKAGEADTDAVNVKQLNDLKAAGFGLTAEDNETIRKPLGESIKVTGDNNVNTKILKEGNNATGLEVSLANNIKLGQGTETATGEAGKLTLTDDKGKDRAVLDGTDGSLTLTGNALPAGTAPATDAPSAKIKVAKGKADLSSTPDEAPNTAPSNKTRITYEIPSATGGATTIEELATLNDGLKFGANTGDVHDAKLNTRVDVKGKATNTTWGNFDEGQNIMTQINGNTITVALAKALSGLTSATFGDSTANPKDIAVIDKDGLTISDGNKTVKLTDKVFDNGGNQIKNIASGLTKDDGSATTSLAEAVKTNGVNVGDLKTAIDNITAGNDGNGNNNPLGGFGLKDKQGNTFKQNLGDTAAVIGDANVNTKVVDFTDPKTNTKSKALEVSLANQLSLGKGPDANVPNAKGEAGKVTLKDDKGTDRVVVDGSEGAISLTGQPTAQGGTAPTAKIKVAEGNPDLANTSNDPNNPNGNKKTRITYEIPNSTQGGQPTVEELATLNDGLKFGANDGAVHNAKLNTRVDVKGHVNNTTWANFDAGQNIMTQIRGNTITVALAKALAGLDSATFGNPADGSKDGAVINKDGLTITQGDKTVKLTENGLDNGGNQIVNVATGLKDRDGKDVKLKDATGDVLTNGVNVGDLKNAITDITSAGNGGFGLKDKAGNEFKQDLGTAAQITGDSNINTKVVDVTNPDGSQSKALEVSLADNITLGKPTEGGVEGVDGSVKVTGKDGASVVLNGKDGTIGLTGPRGADGKSVSTDIGVKEGAAGVDGTDGANGTSKTRIVYTLKDKDGNPIKDASGKPITEEVATLNDGMKFEGNDGTVVTRKLNETLGIKGGIDAATVKDNSKVSSGNVGVRAVTDQNGNPTGSLEVVMKERPEFSGIVLNGKDGQDASIKFTDKDGNESLSMTTTKDKDGNPTLNLTNPNADKFVKITGVADGDISPTSKDAVNGSQLHAVKETAELAASGWNISVNDNANNNVSNVKPKHTVDLNNTDGNIVISKTVDNDKHNVTFGLADSINVKDSVVVGPKGADGKPGEGAVVINAKDGANGKDGISIVGKDGKDAVAISGKDGVGTIGLTGPAGADGKNANAIIGVKDSVKGLDGNDGKDGNSKTRIVYKKPDGTEEQVATMNDGLVFGADKGTEHKAKLGTTVKVKGDDKNIETEVAGDTIRVKLKDNIDVKGVTVREKFTVEKGAAINMGNNVINGVADGEVSATSKQAVNGSQLHKVQQQVNNNTTAINKLGDHINKVDKDLRAGVAGATAVAFLQRPNEAGKSLVSLGVGHYKSESAVAVGYARNSDNNKISIKLGGGVNSRGDVNLGGSIGYQW